MAPLFRGEVSPSTRLALDAPPLQPRASFRSPVEGVMRNLPAHRIDPQKPPPPLPGVGFASGSQFVSVQRPLTLVWGRFSPAQRPPSGGPYVNGFISGNAASQARFVLAYSGRFQWTQGRSQECRVTTSCAVAGPSAAAMRAAGIIMRMAQDTLPRRKAPDPVLRRTLWFRPQPHPRLPAVRELDACGL